MKIRHHLLALLARILIAVPFLIAAINQVYNFSGSIAFVASQGLIFPQVTFLAGLFIEIVAALMILLGWKARFGAFILVIYLLVITFAFHHFWDLQSVTEAQTEMHHFGKNLIIIGGLLYVMAFGPGKICLSQKERMMR